MTARRAVPTREAKRVEVWIVEDNDLLRDSYADVLEHTAGIRCPHAFSNCEEALACLESASPPDLLLMDIGLPGIDGIEGARRVHAISPTTEIMMLTVHEDRENVFRALCAGATGYVVKPSSAAGVVDAIDEWRQGGVPMSAQIARKVLEIFQRWAAPVRDYGLTAREVEVLQQLVGGHSQRRIAGLLGLSPHTVNSHVRNIYAKLHVQSRTGAAAKALQEHLI
jgi:DNA-binding NarL/FixJ family response regulator